MSLTYGVDPAIIEQINAGPEPVKYWRMGLEHYGMEQATELILWDSEQTAMCARRAALHLHPEMFGEEFDGPVEVTKEEANKIARDSNIQFVVVWDAEGEIVAEWEVTP